MLARQAGCAALALLAMPGDGQACWPAGPATGSAVHPRRAVMEAWLVHQKL